MKKTILLLLALMLTMGTSAQKQYRIWRAGDSHKVTLAENPTIAFSEEGTVLTIGDSIYQAAEIDSITMIHQVFVNFDGTSASVTVPAAVADSVSYETDGAHVTLTNKNIAQEIEFVLSGTATDGSFTYNGSYKATVRLNGVSLTSSKGAAIDIECGKRINVILEAGTENFLTDCVGGEQKACFYCKGHMEMSGAGILNVTGNSKHGISTKEYLKLKKSTGIINILAAASDAINVNQYYQQNGGTINITGDTQGDGIQVDSTATATDTLNGQILIKGGTLNIEITHEDCRAIKSADNITITGGTFAINNSGNGSRAIQAGIDIVISDGDDTEDDDEEVGTAVTPTTITINATGGLCTIAADKDDPHRCMGIHAKRDLTINGGTTTVTMASGVYGIRVKRNLTVNGGNTIVKNTTGGNGTIRVAGIVERNGGTIKGSLVKA